MQSETTPKQTETTANAVVGSEDYTNDMKLTKQTETTPKQTETTANAVVGPDVTLSDDRVDPLLIAELETACSQQAQRDSGLRRFYNDIAPGPKVQE